MDPNRPRSDHGEEDCGIRAPPPSPNHPHRFGRPMMPRTHLEHEEEARGFRAPPPSPNHPHRFGHPMLPPAPRVQQFPEPAMGYLGPAVSVNEYNAYRSNVPGSSQNQARGHILRSDRLASPPTMAGVNPLQGLHGFGADSNNNPQLIGYRNTNTNQGVVRNAQVVLHGNYALENIRGRGGHFVGGSERSLFRAHQGHGALQNHLTAQNQNMRRENRIQIVNNRGLGMLVQAATADGNDEGATLLPPKSNAQSLSAAPVLAPIHSMGRSSAMTSGGSVDTSPENPRIAAKKARLNRMIYMRAKRNGGRSASRARLGTKALSKVDLYEMKRVRNRESVQKCRKKKKERTESLKIERIGLNSDNAVFEKIVGSEQLKLAFQEAFGTDANLATGMDAITPGGGMGIANGNTVRGLRLDEVSHNSIRPVLNTTGSEIMRNGQGIANSGEARGADVNPINTHQDRHSGNVAVSGGFSLNSRDLRADGANQDEPDVPDLPDLGQSEGERENIVGNYRFL